MSNVKKCICAGIGLLLIAQLTGCGKRGEFEEAARPIKYTVVEKGDTVQKKVYNGISRNITESQLSFRVPGMVEELPIKVGQAVKKDQMLAQLDPTDYQTKVNEREAQYVSAEADIKRYRLLYEEESATKQELDQAQANYDIAKAQYDLAKQELEYAVLKAPNDGQVVEVPVEVHENVSAGQTICILETGKELEVNVGLPERLIGRVHNGDKTQVRFSSIKDKAYSAVVTEVGVRIDEKTATFPVTVEIEGYHDELRAGMVADVEFTFKPLAEGAVEIRVPSQAVLEDPAGDRYVWVYDEKTEAVKKRKVEVGKITQGGVEIISGLENGEIVATAGAHYLKEGQKAKLMR